MLEKPSDGAVRRRLAELEEPVCGDLAAERQRGPSSAARSTPPPALGAVQALRRLRRLALDRARRAPPRLRGTMAVEGGCEDLFDRVRRDELEHLPCLRGELDELGLVLARQDDALQP